MGAGVTSFTDAGLVPGTYYGYWVWSVNATGRSPTSLAIAANTMPP